MMCDNSDECVCDACAPYTGSMAVTSWLDEYLEDEAPIPVTEAKANVVLCPSCSGKRMRTLDSGSHYCPACSWHGQWQK